MENYRKIKYPYLPEGREIKYVSNENVFMQYAKDFARKNSLDSTIQTGSVIVLNDKVLGCGANGSIYHKNNICERIKRNISTGQGYELCEGCHPKNHSERKAIENAKELGYSTKDADLYLWGHWWCCKDCWNAILEANIKNVYLLEDSEILFNKEEPDNIIGKQFDNN